MYLYLLIFAYTYTYCTLVYLYMCLLIFVLFFLYLSFYISKIGRHIDNNWYHTCIIYILYIQLWLFLCLILKMAFARARRYHDIQSMFQYTRHGMSFAPAVTRGLPGKSSGYSPFPQCLVNSFGWSRCWIPLQVCSGYSPFTHMWWPNAFSAYFRLWGS